MNSDSITSGTNNWIVYFKMVEDKITSVVFDLGVRVQVPLHGFPIVTRIRIPLLQPNPDGLTVNEEAELLDKMGEKFEALVEKCSRNSISKPYRLIYVGRVTAGGQRTLYFYSNYEIEKYCFVSLEREFPGRAFKAESTRDADWKIYLTSLHPGKALNPLLHSRNQLEFRIKKGDQFKIPRDVTHTLIFEDKSGRDKFLEYVKDDGWSVRIFDTENNGEESSSKFMVDLTKFEPIVRMLLDIYIIALSSRAELFGGRYDGWGAYIKESSIEST